VVKRQRACHLRVERGDHHIADEHLADAIQSLLEAQGRATTEGNVPAVAGAR
jgi:hypothetical protein